MFTSRKENLLSDMNDIYKGLNEASLNRSKYARSWSEFGKRMSLMLKTQNPNVTKYLDQFQELYNEIGKSHQRLAEEELRNSEDFRDVIERFTVVYRSNQDYVELKNAYQVDCDSLKNAIYKDEIESKKPTYEQQKSKLQLAIEKARENKKNSLEKVIESLKKIIEIREKYNKFKVRRFREGWARYGLALKNESEKETELLERIKELLNNLKSNLLISNSNLQEIENNLEQHLSNSPIPIEEPIIEEHEKVIEINSNINNEENNISNEQTFDNEEENKNPFMIS